jgi:hypothetical protein
MSSRGDIGKRVAKKEQQILQGEAEGDRSLTARSIGEQWKAFNTRQRVSNAGRKAREFKKRVEKAERQQQKAIKGRCRATCCKREYILSRKDSAADWRKRAKKEKWAKERETSKRKACASPRSIFALENTAMRLVIMITFAACESEG